METTTVTVPNPNAYTHANSNVIPPKPFELGSITWNPDGNGITAGDPKEVVDHPSHYNTGKIEVVDAIADWGLNFQLGNVVKYTARAGHKDDILIDLEKAKWYLQYEIDRIKKEREA